MGLGGGGCEKHGVKKRAFSLSAMWEEVKVVP